MTKLRVFEIITKKHYSKLSWNELNYNQSTHTKYKCMKKKLVS